MPTSELRIHNSEFTGKQRFGSVRFGSVPVPFGSVRPFRFPEISGIFLNVFDFFRAAYRKAVFFVDSENIIFRIFQHFQKPWCFYMF